MNRKTASALALSDSTRFPRLFACVFPQGEFFTVLLRSSSDPDIVNAVEVYSNGEMIHQTKSDKK